MKTKRLFLRQLMLLPLLIGGISNLHGTNSYFYARMTATPAQAGAGLVYAKSTSSATIAENLYTNSSIVAPAGSEKGKYETDFNFYVYAKPVREYRFDHWTISGCVTNSKNGYSLKVTKHNPDPYSSTTQNNLKITTDGKENTTFVGIGGEADYQEVSAVATFAALSHFVVTYQSAMAPYKIDYAYAKLISDAQMETKIWESYTVIDEDQKVASYAGDKVTLSTSITDGFQGWFKNVGGTETSVSTATTCNINPDAAVTYYPKWTAAAGNVASVNGTGYSTLEAAIAAANAVPSGTAVTVQLLNYIFYSGTEPLDLTRSMTIDLKGKNLYGTVGKLFRVNGEGITVTMQDTGSQKGKILVMDANAGQFQAIDVKQGNLINNGAAIQIQNNLAESDFTESTLTSIINVQADGSFTNQSGTLTATSNANIYGVYSQGNTLVSGGTITVTATTNNANGIFATGGTLAVTGGTINVTAAIGANGIVTDGNAQGGAASAIITTATITAKGTTQNAAALRVIDGSIIVNGGTFTVNTTPTGAYGAVSGAETLQTRKGYPNNGSLTINGGTFTVTATAGAAFGVFVNPSITIPGTDGYVATTVTGGKYKMTGSAKGVVNSTAAGVQISGGMFNIDIQALNHIKVGYHSKTMASGDTGYSDGYRFQVIEGENTQAVCKIVNVDNLEFSTLEAALGYVSNHPNQSLTILMLKPYYMSQPGIYTLPSNAGLLLPYNAQQTDYYNLETSYVLTYEQPSMYMQLTLGEGVQLNVAGKIEVSGRQFTAGQGTTGAGVPTGAYGQLHLEPGCKITLLQGAELRAWGFITGNGEIDVRKGATVKEQFQMMDWKGGSRAKAMLDSGNKNTYKVFPVNQYFIQNVEAPTTFHPGAALYAIGGVHVSLAGSEFNPRANVKIIGNDSEIASERDNAMFLMNPAAEAENTWVRKLYDAEHDRQVYEVNSSASLGSIIISLGNMSVLGDIEFDSKDYVLPITNNMKIHLLTGEMGITQSTVMLPGAEIEIDKEATVAINSEKALYLYDIKQWGKYVFSNSYGTRLKYSPAFNGAPSDVQRKIVNSNGSSALSSAAINVHGTFDVRGSLFTTTDGANIFSTVADAGTVKFTARATASGSVYQPDPSYEYATTSIVGQDIPSSLKNPYIPAACTSAQLKNEDGSYQTTVGTSSGKSFCFIDMKDGRGGRWTSLITDECFVYDEASGLYYAKPADYVALKNGKNENADHTYSSIDGSRTLILTGGCQWWEVEYQEESGLYFCEKNGIYYYYDEDDEWLPKTYNVSWQNWDGTPLKDENNIAIVYALPYGTMPFFNSNKPITRVKDDYYTYDFAGWEPALAPVTEDVTYVAKFDRKDVMYTITWNWTEGETAKSKAEYYKVNVLPETPAGIDMTGKEWNPALTFVTKDQIYTLQEKNVNGPFDIKFFNWNGVQIGTTQSIAKNNMPILPADPEQPYNAETNPYPVKPAIDDVEFIFTGWSPEIVAATANASYTAIFEEKPITYTITWNWADGIDAEHSTTRVTENVVPNSVPQYTYEVPSRPEDANNSYVFNGWEPTIGAATEDAIYTATYIAVPKDMEISDAQTLPASSITTVSNMIVHPSGTLTVPNTATLKAANLILEASENASYELNASGQIIVNPGYESRLQIAGNVYFDLTLNTPARHWHAFGVPWRVDIAATPLKEVETGRTLTLGRDYDIIYYNGTKRASQGPGAHCWEYVEDNGKTLTPGQGYMIAFTSAVQTVRFTKAAGAPVIFNGSNSVTGGSGDDGGWNAIANPMAYHATLNAGPTVGYVHDGGEIGSDGYVPYNISGKRYIVGKAVYVQATATQPVVINPAGTAGDFVAAAPARRRAMATDKTYLSLEDYYRVSLADAAGKSGSVYILPEEDKADQYVIGHDLSQFGMNATKPQLWINRYGTQLALNTTAPVDGVAEFPMSVYAPAEGEYTIALAAQPDDENALYLTKDGEVIWNLSDGAYTLTLANGTAANYGLRIGEKKAPEVATGFGEAVVDAHGKTTKVLIDGKVFIIREDRVYSIDGQLVK